MAAGDLNFDPSDPVQVAVKLVRLEEAHAALMERHGEALRGVQAELRGVGDQLRDLTKLGSAQENHSAGLARAFEAIRALAEETRNGFSERDEGLESWKEKHTAENQQTRERLILWNGVAMGISILATTLVALLVYVYVGDKQAAAGATARVEAKADRNGDRLQDVERYLTQEGALSNRPYTPGRR